MDAKYAGKTQKELIVEILLSQTGTRVEIKNLDEKVTTLSTNLTDHKVKVWDEIDELNNFKSNQEGKQEGIKETKTSSRKMWMVVIAFFGVVASVVIYFLTQAN